MIKLPTIKIKLKDVTNNKDFNSCISSVKVISNFDIFCLIRAVLFAIECVEKDPERHNMLQLPNKNDNTLEPRYNELRYNEFFTYDLK